MSKIYYVYVLKDEQGIQYIGVRGHKDPYNDTYMGSYTSSIYNPIKKTIIALFLSKEEAYKYEIHLHNKYNVGVSSKFANKCKAHSTKFSVEGIAKTEAQIQSSKQNARRVGLKHKGVNNPFYGKSHTAETKARQRAAMLGNKNNADLCQYLFLNKNGTEFIGTRQEFKTKFNFNKNSDCLFKSSGTTYTYKGWRASCLINLNIGQFTV